MSETFRFERRSVGKVERIGSVGIDDIQNGSVRRIYRYVGKECRKGVPSQIIPSDIQCIDRKRAIPEGAFGK